MRMAASPHQTGRMLQASANLILRDCDEGLLVFDEKTGKTSLLNHQGALILRALGTARGVDEAIVRRAAGLGGDSDHEEFQSLISSLENSGLVVHC